MTSCITTIWDPHWDPRLRRLIHDVLRRKADFTVTAAFEKAGCTTLPLAKRLNTLSSCLDVFTEQQRAQFIEAVGAADCKGDCELYLHHHAHE
jgi:hypothetical protein